MKMKKVSLFLFFFSFCIVPAFSQTAVLTGYVTDGKTNESLSGANVTISSQRPEVKKMGASSSRDGAYKVTGIPPGVYFLSVSYIGYQTFIIDSLSFSAGETKKLDISLLPEDLEMQKIDVYAERQRIDKTIKLRSTASVTTLDTVQIQSWLPMTPADHLTGLSGVNVVKTGIYQSNVDVRGFNDVFSGSLLLMVDNRIGRVPSLRFNAYNFIPNSNEDIERIDIIRGPASSLYGPNSANGVMHILTKSPFDSEGYTLNFGYGQRNIYTMDFRYAGNYNDKIGYKFTGSFIQGDDFVSGDAYEDSVRTWLLEADAYYRERGLSNPARENHDTYRIGVRDFLIKKIAGTLRVDYRLTDNATLIMNGGYNRANNMELTKIGAAVLKNWSYVYGQTKFIYKNLFMQAFINMSNSGDTYLTRDGADLIDRSKFFSYQVQNTYSVKNRHKLTYGLDAFFTRPVTEGTVHGSNENDDNISEIGIYLQSESDLLEKLKLILAGRLDENNRLKNPFFSPRAGAVINLYPGNKLRFSINRGFSTPTPEHLFLDRVISPMISHTLITLSSFVKFQPFNVRVSGIPKSGFTFRRDDRGGINGLYMQPVPLYASPPVTDEFIPADAALMWDKVVDIVSQIKGSGLDFVINKFRDVKPPSSGDVSSVLKIFNPSTGKYKTIDPSTIKDIAPLTSTKTTTYEMGYEGVIGNRLLLNVNLYQSTFYDFIGPLLIETPNVFFDRRSLENYLIEQESLILSRDPLISAGPILADWISGIPLGTVTPQESKYPGDLLLTYRNFGDVNLYGMDLDLSCRVTNGLEINGTYSFVSKDIFRNLDGLRDVALNAPKNKYSIGLRYKNLGYGFNCDVRYRYVEGFPVNSGVYAGEVKPYNIVDLNAGINFPGRSGIRMVFTVQNLLDFKHKEFLGAPELGRLCYLQMKFFFDKYKK